MAENNQIYAALSALEDELGRFRSIAKYVQTSTTSASAAIDSAKGTIRAAEKVAKTADAMAEKTNDLLDRQDSLSKRVSDAIKFPEKLDETLVEVTSEMKHINNRISNLEGSLREAKNDIVRAIRDEHAESRKVAGEKSLSIETKITVGLKAEIEIAKSALVASNQEYRDEFKNLLAIQARAIKVAVWISATAASVVVLLLRRILAP